MVIDDALHAEVVRILGLSSEPELVQNAAVEQVLSIAENRLIMLAPQLLSDAQLAEAEQLFASGVTADSIMRWLSDEVPNYNKLVRSVILDVADEATSVS